MVVLCHSHVTAVFVNMVFSNKDKILIKNLHLSNGVGCLWNFQPKDGWNIASRGCFCRSSEKLVLFSEQPKAYRQKC